MLIFEKIVLKNFMSVGNTPLELDLNKHQTNLITAKNGVGKSSITLDSISFALYNRAYRNINKNQLINSINQKNLIVTVEVANNGKKYKIVRGIKPAVFEIYENGILVNQDPTSRDYQKHLEQNILKMNYRAFTQIVIMGSASYVPFMKLKPQDRRDFIEDLFDIRVFSVMGKILATKIKETKESIRISSSEIDSLRQVILVMDSNVKSRSAELTDRITELTENIATSIREITKDTERIKEFQEKDKELDTLLKSYDDMTDECLILVRSKKTLDEKIVSIQKDIISCKNMDTCPSCKQGISEEIRNSLSKDDEDMLKQYLEYQEKLDVKIKKLSENLKGRKTFDEARDNYRDSITTLNQMVYANNLLITKMNKELSSLSESPNIDEEKKKMKAKAKELIKLDEKKKDLESSLVIQNYGVEMLKDSGIKSKVIKQFIPSINKLINKYLAKLDFWCHFTMDEEFNEVVKSRYRDAFSYDSFSQGEKQKIDTSILFAFRDIAAMKNSVHTNLIIMDEILDTALDSDVLNLCFDLLKTFKKSNVFVVSHRENISDRFDNTIKLVKKHNFTEISA